MQISENDLWILSYYAASELAGALILGRLARETDDDELRVRLIEHAAEEAQHARLWTETIVRVGGSPRRVRETYQSRYYVALGTPTSLLEVLALTQVFERRVVRHFRAHLRWPGTHPAVVDTLRRMIAEEIGHIGWVKAWLDRYARARGESVVAETMRRFTEVDRRVYEEVLPYRDRMAELAGGGAPARAAQATTDDPMAAEVRRLVARSLDVSEDMIRADSSLRDLGVNSLGLVLLVMSLEETFRIEFAPEDLERLRTFSDLVRRVDELRAVTTGAGTPQ